MDDRKSPINLAAFVQDSTGDAEVVHVCGEIDVSNELEFHESIDRASVPGRPIVIDLTKCTHIGSGGFHVIADCRDAAKTEISIVAPLRIARLLPLLGLSDLLHVPESLNGAAP
jgi:anti-anti-sigma factor